MVNPAPHAYLHILHYKDHPFLGFLEGVRPPEGPTVTLFGFLAVYFALTQFSSLGVWYELGVCSRPMHPAQLP